MFIFKSSVALALALLTAHANGAPDLKEGLVGYWNFNDCTATDQSGNGNHGAIKGSPVCIDTIEGKGLIFNGTTDYIEIPNSISLNVSTITLVAWINPSKLNDGNIVINKEYQYEMAITGKFLDTQAEPGGIVPGSAMFAFSEGSTWRWHSGNVKPEINTYTLLAVTLDFENNFIFFADRKNTRKGVYPNRIAPNSNCIRIGARGCPGTSGSHFSGIIDEVRIYNRALTKNEIDSIYYRAYPPMINGTAPWATPKTVTCTNLTNNSTVVIPSTKSSSWDCEQAGLIVDHGDLVDVTIRGKKY